jgi:NAD(P)-dependent dehydrogenase (short-subunit alcohol dehydrogenase family)
MTQTDLFNLSGKAAIVLGAGQGMGEATAMLLAEVGVRVAIIDLESARAIGVRDSITRRGGHAVAIEADVLDDSSLAEAYREAQEQLGGLDIMVAIVGEAIFKSALNLTGADWDRDYRLNIRYLFLAAQHFARMLIARKTSGVITCMSSMSGVRSGGGHAAYGAMKAGIVNLARTLAVEWADHGIRVNTVTPGTIITPKFPNSPEVAEYIRHSLIPMRRSGSVHDIAKAVLFLSSDMAAYTTGHNLLVDGGWDAANLFRQQ